MRDSGDHPATMSPSRLRLLDVLEGILDLIPDFRFGQLLCNLTSWVERSPGSTWRVTDSDLLVEAEGFLNRHRERVFPRGEARARLARSLLQALGEVGECQPDRPFGRLVADLVAHQAPPRSVIEWAGRIWDIEDDALLAAARAVGRVTVPGCDEASLPYR